MKDPIRPFVVSTLLLITFLLISNYVFAAEKSKWLNENPCMIKVVITERCKDSQCLIKETTKEEVLKCNDGYDGPICSILLCRLDSSCLLQRNGKTRPPL